MADEEATNDPPVGSPHGVATTAAQTNLPAITLEPGQDDTIEADVR